MFPRTQLLLTLATSHIRDDIWVQRPEFILRLLYFLKDAEADDQKQ